MLFNLTCLAFCCCLHEDPVCIWRRRKSREGFLQVLQSSECQADKYMGWPDRSPFFLSQPSLSPPALLSISPGHRWMTADYIGYSLMSMGTRPSGWNDTGWWQADPLQTPTDITPIHSTWSHDTNLILVCKGPVLCPPVFTKTENDQQGRPFFLLLIHIVWDFFFLFPFFLLSLNVALPLLSGF